MGQQCCGSFSKGPSVQRTNNLIQTSNRIQNALSNQTVETYPFQCNNDAQYDLLLDVFNLRLNHPYLVASRQIYNNQPVDGMCGCGAQYSGQIALERISSRLSSINEIPFPDILHVYHHAFKGFAELASHLGYFIVEENMICINHQDVVKVWMNSNLPESYISSLKLKTEAEMITTIIDKIDRNTKQQGLPKNIRQFFRERSVVTFNQAIQTLQQYASLYHTIIPTRINTVKGVSIYNSTLRNQPITPIVQTPTVHRIQRVHAAPLSLSPISHGRSRSVSKVGQGVPVVKPLNRFPSQSPLRMTPTNSLSPIRRNVSRSLTKSNAVVSKPLTLSPLPIRNATPNRVVRNLNFNNPYKVRDGHSSDNIWNIIKQSKNYSSNKTPSSLPRNTTDLTKKEQIKKLFPKVNTIARKDMSTRTQFKPSEFQTPNRVKQIVEITKNAKFEKPSVTNFEFYGTVGLQSKALKQTKETNQKVSFDTERTYRESATENYLNHIESRIQNPPLLTPIKEGIPSTVYPSSGTQQEYSTYEQKYTHEATPVQPFQSTFQKTEYTAAFNPIGYQNSSATYGATDTNTHFNNYKDQYTVKTSYETYTPITHEVTYSAYTPYNPYTPTYNYSDLYSGTLYNSNALNVNDLETYKTVTNEYKSVTDYGSSTYDYGLKNTYATNYDYSSVPNYSQNLNLIGDKYESYWKYNLQNLASVYVPIEGYKVSIDNELLADLQKLRAGTLMSDAIEKQRSRQALNLPY